MPFIILCIVATPFVFAAWLIHRIFLHRMQMKQLTAMPATPRALPPSDDVQRRLANLESIICSLDYDLAKSVHETTDTRAA